MSEKVRTRFAPSPTGFLHVGGMRTALFAWLVARQAGGQFILRIEDTDKKRFVAGSEQHIMDSLKWLGLDWDEGPIRQSERRESYINWAHKLLETGRAYADPRTSQELDNIRRQAAQQKRPVLFREHRLKQPPSWQVGIPLRFRSEPKAYKWQDEVMGELKTGPEVIDDFILIKSDGLPTYNFAHIVDDSEMRISHIIRSQEFLASVPKFLNLYEALDFSWPKLATLPYVLGPDGKKKLSKRDGAKDVMDYRQEGYLPEALVSFLATLGWNDGTEQEIFSLQELIEKFSLDRVHRGGAQFDEQRLIWTNGHFIRETKTDKLNDLIDGENKKFWGKGADAPKPKKVAVLGLVKERLKYFSELVELTDFFFTDPQLDRVIGLYLNPVDKELKKDKDIDRDKKFLEAIIKELEQSDFSEQDIKNRLNRLLKSLDTKPGIMFALIRIAITGKQSSPEIFSTLSVLGKKDSLQRLNKASEALEKKA